MKCPICATEVEVPDGYIVVTCHVCGTDLTVDSELVV